MMLLKIAWRNVWRHKTRSLVIVLSVMIGLWSGLFLQAYVNGIAEQRVSSAIEKEISHIQLHHLLFKTNYDVKYVIPSGPAKLREISKMPEVQAVSGRVISKGMIASASGSA